MELAKNYEPKTIEDRWYADWLAKGCFKATPGTGTPYCITIPPPNVTGSLHMGHALNNTIIDTLIRWHRMRGDNTLCVPGTDHAGIATQNVVERDLAKEGLTRFDLGREKFIERCWQWREQYGSRIYQQFHKLGCSYDWDRARFTMDETYVEAIYEEFLRWWERGLIYRGARVVNWCPRCQSAISDIEVETQERAGKLYHFRYPFADGSGFVTIATTRPETLLGDAAVAVNPTDTRYEGKVGKSLRLPIAEREIPLIADEYAKKEFGTGAVKVTPAHDLNDFEAGLRNHLPQIIVIAPNGTMTGDIPDAYKGLDRFDARQKVVADMEARGLLDKIEDYTIQIPTCDRCGTVIEPLLSEQWFARQEELAARAMTAAQSGDVRFLPERYQRIFLDWMSKIQPWCISRQLWWGHRIPVWWTEDGKYAAARNGEEAAQKLGVPADHLRQDEDVLDTWFSSALWPHAVLGWPRETADLAFWYPTSLLSTAQEILFLWVARMMMTGLDFLGEKPFEDVYIHATVLDAKGERMSKSKGNGIDPMDLIEQYGADAVRFSLLQLAGKNQDFRYSEERVKLAAAFCNKFWNASRFVLTGLGETPTTAPQPFPEPDALATADRWILSRLNQTIEQVNAGLASYDMDDAMRAFYAFFWDEFCDWYVELAKPRLRGEGAERETAGAVLTRVLETTLRLAHPMMPFVTEEIWQAMRAGGLLTGQESADSETLLFAPYPQAQEAENYPGAEERMTLLIEAVRALRNLRAELGIAPGNHLRGAVVPRSRKEAMTFTDDHDLVAYAARLAALEIHDTPPANDSGTERWVGTPISGGEVFLEIGDALDMPKELERIAKELAAVEKELVSIEGRLGNAQFLEKAAPAIVEKTKAQAAELTEKRARLEAQRALFGGQ